MIAGLQTAISNQSHFAQPQRKALQRELNAVDKAKIKVDRHALLVRGAPIASAASAALAIVALITAWGQVDPLAISIWAGLVIGLSAGILGLWTLFIRRKNSAHGLLGFTRAYVVAMALCGVLWGALAPIFAVYGLIGHAFLPFVIAGMTATALSAAGASWRAVQAFNIPALAPLAVTYALTSGSNGAAIAIVVCVYGAATAYLSWTMEEMIVRLIRLRSRNANLVKTIGRQMDAAQEAEQRFRALVEVSKDVTLIFSPDGYVTYASPSVEVALGESAQNLIGVSTKALLHPDDFGIFKSAGERALTSLGEAAPLNHVCMRRAGGSYAALSGRLTNMLYVPGVEGFVFNGAVISEPCCVDGLHAAE